MAPVPLTIVFAPDTALLLPALVPPRSESEQDDALDQLDVLRQSCIEQITEALAEDCRLAIVVAPGHENLTRSQPEDGLAALGVAPGIDPLSGTPVSQGIAAAVGSWLLDAAGWSGERAVISTRIGDSAPSLRHLGAIHAGVGGSEDASGTGNVVILAVGSGSARMSEQSPLPMASEAVAFDQLLEEALASGDFRLLARLCDGVDAATAAHLGVTGWGPWEFAVGACEAATSPDAAPPTAGSRDIAAPPAAVPFSSVSAPFGVSYPLTRWVFA